MKTVIYLIDSLRYKLHMLGIPMEGPTNAFCNNEFVCKNTTKLEAVLKEEASQYAYHRGLAKQSLPKLFTQFRYRLERTELILQ
jgi:hypothetical protein